MIKRFLSALICVGFLLSASICASDEITIRTIITPIGSQSEKWGAAGLMVCIGGETIPNGGCGTSDVTATDWDGNSITIEQSSCTFTPYDEDCGKMVFFIDDGDHEFDSGDTVYEVRGSGASGFCFNYYCSDDNSYIDSPMCSDAGGEQGYCPAGFKQMHSLGLWGRCSIGAGGDYDCFLPPGASCAVPPPYTYSYFVGRAFVCCQ